MDVYEHPPNGQGLCALLALGILEGLPSPALEGDRLHLQIEALRLAFADARAFIAEETPVAELLRPEYTGRINVGLKEQKKCFLNEHSTETAQIMVTF